MRCGQFLRDAAGEHGRNSRLYGVELDSISGRIAKQLYPKADITVAGFETTDRRDFYDLAIGNVPFGQYQVNDKAYNKLGFNIHNYFFAKSLDQVRPGGVVAFVTSRYTMDAKDSTVRRYLAQRAELLGAIRLPNNAFKANAGTEVVSDIHLPAKAGPSAGHYPGLDADRPDRGRLHGQPVFSRPPGDGAGAAHAPISTAIRQAGLHRGPHRGAGAGRPAAQRRDSTSTAPTRRPRCRSWARARTSTVPYRLTRM